MSKSFQHRYQKLLYPVVFIADRNIRNFRKLLTTALWILGFPKKTPSLEPLGQILSYSSLLILPLSNKFLKSCLNYFSTFTIWLRCFSGVIFSWKNLLKSELARFTPSIYFSLPVITRGFTFINFLDCNVFFHMRALIEFVSSAERLFSNLQLSKFKKWQRNIS